MTFLKNIYIRTDQLLCTTTFHLLKGQHIGLRGIYSTLICRKSKSLNLK